MNKPLYIVAVDSNDRFEIYLQNIPLEIQQKRTPRIATFDIVGRNNPLYQYTGGETSISLELDFYSTQDDRKDVIDTVRRLESFCYSDGGRKSPSRLKLVFGELYKNQIWLVSDISTKLSQFHPEHDYLPCQAYVSMTLKLAPDKNLKHEDIL